MSKRRDPETLAEGFSKFSHAVVPEAAARLAGVSESQMYQSCARARNGRAARRFGRVLVLAVPFLEAFGASSAVADVVAEGAPCVQVRRGGGVERRPGLPSPMLWPTPSKASSFIPSTTCVQTARVRAARPTAQAPASIPARRHGLSDATTDPETNPRMVDALA